jgi:hypothetical protein
MRTLLLVLPSRTQVFHASTSSMFHWCLLFLKLSRAISFSVYLLVVTSPMMSATKLGGLGLSAVEPVSSFFYPSFCRVLGVK